MLCAVGLSARETGPNNYWDWYELSRKFVFGENVAQTAQFVQTGNADAGFVAMSLAASRFVRAGHFYEIPADDYPALEQMAVLTKAGAGKPIAQAYLAFLRSDEAGKILERFGFRLPK